MQEVIRSNTTEINQFYNSSDYVSLDTLTQYAQEKYQNHFESFEIQVSPINGYEFGYEIKCKDHESCHSVFLHTGLYDPSQG